MLPLPFLLLAVQDDTDRAFMEKLYTDYGTLMYHQARQIARCDADAQDAVSEALLALIKKIPVLRAMPCNKQRAYVVITVKHLAIDRYRRLQREDVAWQADAPDAASFALTEDHLMEQAGMENLKNAIACLPQRERDALTMRYFLRLSEEEIARSWQVRPVSVRVALSRARNHLKELLSERREMQ